jgi:transcriptional/translational regulatory protein YebC/TACO1
VLDAGAEDLTAETGAFHVTCEPVKFDSVKHALEKAGITPDLAEIQRVPGQTVKLDRAGARRVLDLVSQLEDHDDVQNVYANFDIDDEVMQEIAASS